MPHSELLREVARLYIRQQRQAVGLCDGTSLTQCSIVGEIGRAGALSLAELAQAIGFDKSWASRAVDSLVQEGLVTKKSDAGDARKVRLTLTRKGEARFEAINATLDAHARNVLQHLSAADRRAVASALGVLEDALRTHSEIPIEVACAR